MDFPQYFLLILYSTSNYMQYVDLTLYLFLYVLLWQSYLSLLHEYTRGLKYPRIVDMGEGGHIGILIFRKGYFGFGVSKIFQGHQGVPRLWNTIKYIRFYFIIYMLILLKLVT